MKIKIVTLVALIATCATVKAYNYACLSVTEAHNPKLRSGSVYSHSSFEAADASKAMQKCHKECLYKMRGDTYELHTARKGAQCVKTIKR